MTDSDAGDKENVQARHRVETAAGCSTIPFPYLYRMMQKNTWNKEAYLSGVPRGFRKKRFRFTAEVIGLLAGTTKDNVGNIIGKCLPYYNPLSHVRLTPGSDASFHRPRELQTEQL